MKEDICPSPATRYKSSLQTGWAIPNKHFVHLNQPVFLLFELIDGLLSFFYTLLGKKLFLVIELESHTSNPEIFGCKFAF